MNHMIQLHQHKYIMYIHIDIRISGVLLVTSNPYRLEYASSLIRYERNILDNGNDDHTPEPNSSTTCILFLTLIKHHFLR